VNAPAATGSVAPSVAGYDLIRTLVAFDTTSRESNLALIHWVRDYFAGHGIGSLLTFDDDRRKANLFATLPAMDGNATTGGMVLSGHSDVVPVDGQPWDSDPFEVKLADGRLVGRGVADMKSFSAIGLALVPELLRRGLRRPVHFALSYDEEVGCIGVRRLIPDIVARGIKPAGCIIGEPTGMRPVVAHKGKRSFRCRVRGHAAHSALTPLGVNAVQIASELVVFLSQMARRFRDRGGFDAAYDVPYTTVHTGVIRGGSAVNIVPRDCQFDFEFRHLPLDDPDELLAELKRFAATLLPEMHAVDPATFIEFEQLSNTPGFDTHGGNEIVEMGKLLSDSRETGKVSFGSEAALFHGAGIPTVMCGPGHIAQAHQPNEWIALEQLELCEAFMRRLADRICVR
jgi:acetylornithine deacetylase